MSIIFPRGKRVNFWSSEGNNGLLPPADLKSQTSLLQYFFSCLFFTLVKKTIGGGRYYLSQGKNFHFTLTGAYRQAARVDEPIHVINGQIRR